jgi:small-conductance mechanosensitive channel
MADFFGFFTGSEHFIDVVRAVLLVGAGCVAAVAASRVVARLMQQRFSAHHVTLARRLVYYSILTLFIASGLKQLGFSLGVLLGAAGVLSVALGFASQTSVSNLISGLFLIGERPFQVGDIITVADTTGEVLSIDLLSVKLRTFDNLFVRIPNESLIKSQLTTLTRFPLRRIDLKIGVAYKETIAHVRSVLMSAADANPLCLDSPAPLFIFSGFGDSALEIQFSVWAKREQFLELRNSLQEEIKEAFDAEGIEIPFPHRTLYPGSAAEPFPVRVVEEHGARGSSDPDRE